jgi:hypothetical protein
MVGPPRAIGCEEASMLSADLSVPSGYERGGCALLNRITRMEQQSGQHRHAKSDRTPSFCCGNGSLRCLLVVAAIGGGPLSHKPAVAA